MRGSLHLVRDSNRVFGENLYFVVGESLFVRVAFCLFFGLRDSNRLHLLAHGVGLQQYTEPHISWSLLFVLFVIWFLL